MDSNKESASKWLSIWMKEAKVFYIFASLLTLISAGCFVVFSWHLSKFAAEWLTRGTALSESLAWALVFITGRYVFAHGASLLNYKAGTAIVSKIKKKLYPKLLNNNESDSISSTLFLTRISDDLKPFFSFFVPYAIATVLVGILLFAITSWFECWVGITLMVMFIIIPLQMIMIGVGAESLHKKHINLFMKYSAVFYNRLHTIAEIVNLDNLKPQYQFLSDKSKALNTATTNVMRIAILSSAVLELFVTIAIAIIAIYLGMSLLGIMPGESYAKGYDFHIALFLLMLAPYFFFYMRKFVSAYHDRNKAVASAKLLMPLLTETDEQPSNVKDEPFQSLEIKDLNFAYPGSMVKVLHNIHLQMPRKGLVLIKGISGSGKSTLLKILSGSLQVQDGLVSVNQNSTALSAQWLKEHTSYMNQFPFVFDGTLRYNVFLEQDAASAQVYPRFLDKVIDKKEDGWETLLSHNGKQLSGGEKQLLTLARMMLHPKPVALLDEPTANLDHATVAIILEQIKELAKDQLLILASHEDKFDALADVTLNLNWGEQMEC